MTDQKWLESAGVVLTEARTYASDHSHERGLKSADKEDPKEER